MNTRLDEIYQNIVNSNQDSFLSNDLHLDETWGNNIWGVTLQIDLSDNVRSKLIAIQKDLDSLEPDNLLLLPRDYQHVSFNQVVFWGGEYQEGCQKTWDNIHKRFTDEFGKLDNHYESFQIEFNQIIPTQAAIIWCADDEEDKLEQLRESFLKKLPFPPETTKLNHIVHTTIARYKNKLNNPETIVDHLQKIDVTATMIVEKIVLRKELVFPSIRTEDIASISLTDAS